MLLSAVLVLCFAHAILAKGCCIPRKCEGKEIIAGRSNPVPRYGNLPSVFEFSYDADEQKVAVSGRYRKRGQEIKFKVIYDYSGSKGYLVEQQRDQTTCKTFDVKKKFREACIPSDAKVTENTFLGAGDNTLDVTAYEMRFKYKGEYFAAMALVTKVGCIPVEEDVAGSYRGTKFFENVNYVGITLGIQDPTVFDPPASCDRETVDVIDHDFFEKYSMLRFTPDESEGKFEFEHGEMRMEEDKLRHR